MVLQGPREMAHLSPALPAVHTHAAVVVLQMPPAMQLLSLVQPWLPQGCTVWGAGPTPLMQNCKQYHGRHTMYPLDGSLFSTKNLQPASCCWRSVDFWSLSKYYRYSCVTYERRWVHKVCTSSWKGDYIRPHAAPNR